MTDQPLEMNFVKTLNCLEVLHAVQADTRTSAWYWGDVRGKAEVGAATVALWRKDLICSRVGPPPFQLTPKGEAFLKTHQKEWAEFLANTNRREIIEYFAAALKQTPEVHEARDVE
jgi:hypothetical protein